MSKKKHKNTVEMRLTEVSCTLRDREALYGDFTNTAHIAQNLKYLMQEAKNWNALTSVQQEVLEMIATKIGRILNGNPDYEDSWHDIAGYATLAEQECKKNAAS